MKKTIVMFSLGLITGLGNLYAQQDTKSTTTQSTATRSTDSSRSADMKSMDNNRSMNSTPLSNGSDAMGDNKMSMDRKMRMPDLGSWPEASQMAVKEITGKYGRPDGITEDELIWRNKGNWKKICISKMETKHSFPIEHTDMMQQTISYDVPEDKMDDLGKFDGSVTFDRTQGTMSARCDKEGNNMLALNLANDIITGKKTVEQARTAYGDIVKQKMNGGNPEYMQKLTFSPQPNAADPDKNTTGLTKEDVMKGMKKANAN